MVQGVNSVSGQHALAPPGASGLHRHSFASLGFGGTITNGTWALQMAIFVYLWQVRHGHQVHWHRDESTCRPTFPSPSHQKTATGSMQTDPDVNISHTDLPAGPWFIPTNQLTLLMVTGARSTACSIATEGIALGGRTDCLRFYKSAAGTQVV